MGHVFNRKHGSLLSTPERRQEDEDNIEASPVMLVVNEKDTDDGQGEEAEELLPSRTYSLPPWQKQITLRYVCPADGSSMLVHGLCMDWEVGLPPIHTWAPAILQLRL